MNMGEIARVAYDAGIRNTDDLASAISIAMAESGGDPKAYNPRGRDRSYGLWQINMKPSEVGDRKEELGLTSNEQLYDPAVNAKAMFKISKGGKDWGPWTTWPLKAALYRPYALSAAAVMVSKGTVVDTANEAIDTVTESTGVQELAAATTRVNAWVSNRNNWVRVAKVGIGGTLLVAGVILIARPLVTSVAAKEVSKVAGKALKGGK